MCATPHPEISVMSGPSDCIDMDIDEVPVKTIRITFHVFQKDDGSENIPDNPTGRNWLENTLMNSVNGVMSNLDPMNLSTSSPYFSDSKIRYEVMNIYFWKDTDLWAKGDRYNHNHGQDLYDFVMSQSISHKTTSVHLLIPGNYTANGIGIGGRACGIGCNNWSMAEDTYYYYQNNNHWLPANNWRHELGHNFNIYHSWPTSPTDYCGDTPSNSNCWNGSSCSNNMMDYNASQDAITQCQLSRMHEWLENNSSVVKSGLPNYDISGQINWSGGYMMLNPSNIVPDPGLTIDIEAPGATDFDWTKTAGSATLGHNPDGSQAYITIASSSYIMFDISTVANCNEIEESYEIFLDETFYAVFPNPMENQLHVEWDPEKYQKIINTQKHEKHSLKIYDQYRSLIMEKELESNSGSHTLDVSGLKQGMYIVELSNPNFTKTFKVQKL